jgi:DNA-binding HxlR family transcriptional regulator
MQDQPIEPDPDRLGNEMEFVVLALLFDPPAARFGQLMRD